MGYVAKIVYDKDNRVTEENDAHGKIKEMRNRMRKIVAATEENKEEILKLYKIQLGREFCPWDDSYPGMKEIEFDLGRESLFVMIDGQEINADAGSKEDRIIAAIILSQRFQLMMIHRWRDLIVGATNWHPELSFQDLRFIRIFRIRKLRDKCWYLGWKSSQGEDTKVCIF